MSVAKIRSIVVVPVFLKPTTKILRDASCFAGLCTTAHGDVGEHVVEDEIFARQTKSGEASVKLSGHASRSIPSADATARSATMSAG